MKTNSTIIILAILLLGVAGWAQKTPENVPSASAAQDLPTGTVAEPARENLFSASYPGQQTSAYSPWAGGGAGSESPVSVVAFGKADQKTLDETAEDLNILSFILRRNLEANFAGDTREYKLGIPMLLKSGGRWVEASYVENFGVLLHVRVRFPLVPPPNSEAAARPASADSEWDQARRALAGETTTPDWETKSANEGDKFDARLVENLKKRVLEVLRNAANLRHVKPDEWITVCVTGSANGAPGAGMARAEALLRYGYAVGSQTRAPSTDRRRMWPTTKTSAAAANSAPAEAGVEGDATSTPDLLRTTLMTIRLKKSSVDAAAAKKISEGQLMQEAQVSTYLGASAQNSAVLGNYIIGR